MAINKITGQELAPNFKFPDGSVSTQYNTLDDGSGAVTLNGSLTVNGTIIQSAGSTFKVSFLNIAYASTFSTSSSVGIFANNTTRTVDFTGWSNGWNFVPQNTSSYPSPIFSIAQTGAIKKIGSVTTQGTYGIPVIVANTSGYFLTSTFATTVASYTPTVSGNFLINTFIRVITATTTVTLTVTYYDQGGLQQTATILSDASQAVGNYSSVTTYISTGGTSPISVTATAGTSSQVYVSATILAI